MTGSDWLVDERARGLLGDLDQTLRDILATMEPDIQVLAIHVVARGGKRLRPALLFLSASFGHAPDDEALLRAAAALELVHVASLHHDDVMDRAPERRGVASINQRWGNRAAVLTGACLFTSATMVLADLGDDMNRLASQAWAELAAGQLHEAENAFNLEITVEEHLAILERKTATLFELPCRIGASLARADSAMIDALATCGRRLGLAFQLVDDILDITSVVEHMGKRPGTDLREGIYSLPVLIAIRDGGERGRTIVDILSRVHPDEDDLDRALRLVRQTDAIDQSRERAQALVREAMGSIAPLPASNARESLYRLGAYVLARTA
jgi:heptaprenyl diphosphate synthase